MSNQIPSQAVHVQLLVEDYVLGLLSPEERQRFTSHIAHCETCLSALKRERHVVRIMQEALSQAPVLPPERLRALGPTTSSFKDRGSNRLYRLGFVAAFSLLLVVILVTGLTSANRDRRHVLLTATNISLTATAQRTPTAGVAETVVPAAAVAEAGPQIVIAIDDARLPPPAEPPAANLTRVPSWAGMN